MSTHNLCFEQKYEKKKLFLSENFQFLEVKFSLHLNRSVFVMESSFGAFLITKDAVSSWNQRSLLKNCTDAQGD